MNWDDHFREEEYTSNETEKLKRENRRDEILLNNTKDPKMKKIIKDDIEYRNKKIKQNDKQLHSMNTAWIFYIIITGICIIASIIVFTQLMSKY